MRKRHDEVNIWAGFVDVLSSLLILMIFILMIFIIAQTFLKNDLEKTEKEMSVVKQQRDSYYHYINDLEEENDRIKFLLKNFNNANEILSLVKRKDDRSYSLFEELKNEKDLSQSIQNKNRNLSSRINELNTLIQEIQGDIVKKENLIKNHEDKEEQFENSVKSLRKELARLNQVFEATDRYILWQKIQIIDMGKKLNRALANKAAELHKARSSFFEKISKVLLNNEDFKMKGDRFVLQNELMFKSGSAKIQDEGLDKLTKIAWIIQELEKKIDPDVNWVIRIDGHTDNIPVSKNSIYQNNMELSFARAFAVSQFLVKKGVNPKRLAATGFGSYQPSEPNNTSTNRRINRRIEFKLTEF